MWTELSQAWSTPAFWVFKTVLILGTELGAYPDRQGLYPSPSLPRPSEAKHAHWRLMTKTSAHAQCAEVRQMQTAASRSRSSCSGWQLEQRQVLSVRCILENMQQHGDFIKFINTRDCNKIENTEHLFFKYQVSECFIHPLVSNHTMHSCLHCSRGNETERCPTAGEEGRGGIPKHCFVESKRWSKNTFWIYMCIYIYTVHCKQTFGIRINTGQNTVS